MSDTSSASQLYIGLMSGTSLDGVDGVLAGFGPGAPGAGKTLATSYLPFDPQLRSDLMALQSAGHNEIEREASAGSRLARHYAKCVERLLDQAGTPADRVRAIGAHGQTIRHQPQAGFTRQTGNPALLAELTAIDVIADFRSRDIAAGGQGAPLVPAYHQAAFGAPGKTRVIANVGGMANITVLGASSEVIGFDTGPGNVFLDLWSELHLGKNYDAGGAWGASGRVIPTLLDVFCREPYFSLAAPKSTGRDLFDRQWLETRLQAFEKAPTADVQATLAALTARTLAEAIARYAADADAVYVCGGGAANLDLMRRLQAALAELGCGAHVHATDSLGVPANHVEALAFAWLAHRFTDRQPGNLPAVTGAAGKRILGALYPA
jgi:anhydro-N-acetylmuramic acid kinase